MKLTHKAQHPKLRTICLGALMVISVYGGALLASTPTHRYSFESNANDSIGSAHGTLLGKAVITNGALVLNGVDGCVQLPSNLFTNSTSLGLEIWLTREEMKGGSPVQLWWFSGSPITITYALTDGYSIPSRAAYRVSSSTYQSVVDAPFSLQRTCHIVWSQDAISHTARMYLNGLKVGENTNFTFVPGTTSQGYLGALAPTALVLAGKIHEFRIYSNAISHLEVLKSGTSGPNSLVPSADALEVLHLRSPSHVALGSVFRPLVFVNFEQQQAVNITPLDEIIFTSSDTNVISISTNGQLTAVSLGTANITASYNGISDSQLVTVLLPDAFALVHRYSFDGRSDETNVYDLQGNAHGVLQGGGAFTNAGQLYLRGAFLSSAGGYVDLPDGILSSLEETSIEAWITRVRDSYDTVYNNWPRIFDFGSQTTNGGGSSYFMLSPSVTQDNTNLIRFSVSTNSISSESPRLTTYPMMQTNVETHFAVTYDPIHNLSKLYLNGRLASTGLAPTPLSGIVDTNNWLGRSQFEGDSSFSKYFNEFRIYRKALDDSDIAASYALGPDVIGADFVLHSSLLGTNLVVTWGPTAFSSVLKSSSSIGTDANWTDISVTPLFTNGHFEVTLPVTDEARFYQLVFP